MTFFFSRLCIYSKIMRSFYFSSCWNWPLFNSVHLRNCVKETLNRFSKIKFASVMDFLNGEHLKNSIKRSSIDQQIVLDFTILPNHMLRIQEPFSVQFFSLLLTFLYYKPIHFLVICSAESVMELYFEFFQLSE